MNKIHIFCGCMFSLLTGRFLRLGMLSHMVSVYLHKKLPNCFLKWLYYAFPHQYMRVIIAPQPYHQLVLSLFWILAILVGVQWYSVTVFICISLMTNDVEHLLMHFCAIHISFLAKCLFK